MTGLNIWSVFFYCEGENLHVKRLRIHLNRFNTFILFDSEAINFIIYRLRFLQQFAIHISNREPFIDSKVSIVCRSRMKTYNFHTHHEIIIKEECGQIILAREIGMECVNAWKSEGESSALLKAISRSLIFWHCYHSNRRPNNWWGCRDESKSMVIIPKLD